MNIRAIIVDDEPLARERVRTFLAGEVAVEIVAECGNGVDALEAIEQHRPDLLFLDVQMPRMDGFEVLEALKPESMPVIIFTTAHDEHALQAFEVNALDYLLKPFKESRFKKAMNRAREQLKKRAERNWIAPVAARILVKSPDRILFLKPEEVDHIEAAGNYLVLHSGKDRHIVRETMSAMETRLMVSGFMRISRSAIVNLSRIREVQPLSVGEFCVILKSGARLNMTCSLRDLQEQMEKL
jgi:two-component system, LytTR family, response regulator